MYRADLLTKLGLRTNTLNAPLPTYAPHFAIFNFLLSYVFSSARVQKMNLKIDDNVSPRYDLDSQKVESRIASGKITREQVDRLKRIYSAHQNSMEHFPVFIGAMLFATVAGLEEGMVNKYGLLYSVVRVLYIWIYANNTTRQAAGIRSVLWWAGNITCIRLFWFAGKALNAKKGL